MGLCLLLCCLIVGVFGGYCRRLLVVGLVGLLYVVHPCCKSASYLSLICFPIVGAVGGCHRRRLFEGFVRLSYEARCVSVLSVGWGLLFV